MTNLKNIKITPTDGIKELEGTWTNYQGVRLLIARTTKPAYMNALILGSKSMKTKMNQLDVPTEEMTNTVCKALSKYLLLDWQDFVIDGEELPFSIDNAYWLLKNDIDARNFVLEFADEAANYYREEVERVAGEPSPS